MAKHPIIWLTGQSNAGKSTLAELLHQRLGAIVLDGNEMRSSISLGAGMSDEDRIEHNLRVARLAAVLAERHIVVVSVIAPFQSLRDRIHELALPVWVYVKREFVKNPDKPYDRPASYEPPERYDVLADSDLYRPEENAERVLAFLSQGQNRA
jgi:adenylylsulfate kinase-like enzyme